MYLKIIIRSTLIFLLVIIQIAFISGLPSFFGNINLVLVILIMISVFANFASALWWSIAVGTLWDMFSFHFFGLNILSLFVSVLFVNFLLENLFTNRSLYSFLALTVFASIFYELLIFIFYFIWKIFFYQYSFQKYFLNYNFWTNEFSKILANVFVAFILFYIINFFGKKFKPMFLIR